MSEPAPGSRNADGADELTARHARQQALSLLTGAVVEEVMRGDAVHALSEPRKAAPAKFLVDHGLVAEVPAAAAILGRNIRAQESLRARTPPDFLADVLLRAPLRVQRHHFCIGKARD